MSMLLLMLVAAAEPKPIALVTAYQSLGTEPAMVTGLTDKLRTVAAEKGLALVDATEATKLQRAAVMCGEDVQCLATLGARGKAKWVVGFGIARVGSNWLFSALLIDVDKGTRAAMFSRSTPAKELDEAALVQAATAELFRGVELVPAPQVVLVPAPKPEVVKPVPAWVPEVQQPPAHRLRPAAVTTTVLTGALVIATVIVSVLAQSHHQTLAATPIDSRAAADRQQRTLNLGADVLIGVSAAAGVTSVILWAVDARSP